MYSSFSCIWGGGGACWGEVLSMGGGVEYFIGICLVACDSLHDCMHCVHLAL